MMGGFAVPDEAVALQLCKIVKGHLRLSEVVKFERGRDGVDIVLRRAAIAGNVGPVGETGDFWADFMDDRGDIIESIALDSGSWNALKNRWMRCRMVPWA